jgi:Tfp pilus assembly protein PilW
MAPRFTPVQQRHSNGAKAYTLVELLISALIGAVVIGSVARYSVSQFRSNATQDLRVQRNDDANRTANWIDSELARASGFDNSSDTTSGSGCPTPTGTSLVMSMRVPGSTIPRVSFFSPTGTAVGNVVRCGPPVVCTSGAACALNTAATATSSYLVASNARLVVTPAATGTAVRQISYTLTVGDLPVQSSITRSVFAGAPTY